MSRWPRLIIACKAGKIFLYARSPVAPKNTRASEFVSLIVPSSRDLLEMSAEPKSHRREKLVLIIGITARGEAFIKRCAENRSRHGLVDSGLDGPPAFAGVRHAAGEFFEVGIFDQRGRRQIEQPRSYDAASSPNLGDLAQVQIVLVVFGIAQWRGFGINRILLLPDIGAAQNTQAFSIGSHDAVLDTVVNHFDEVAGAVRTAVKITLLRCPAQLLPARCAWDVSRAGCKASEDRIDVFDNSGFAANHHAIAALQAPHTAACAYVDVVNLLRRKLLGATNVVDVVGVAAVDKNVFRSENGCEAGDRFVHHRCRYHQPDHPRFAQLLDEILQ